MKPLPLRVRVLAALELAPMTARVLARALGVSVGSIRHQIHDFVALGVIARCGVERGRNGHPWYVYRINA